MGRAEDLFARFSRDANSNDPNSNDANEAVIHNLIAEGNSEELFLDYKTSWMAPTETRLGDSEKKNYAEAISGFGNGAGGLIIWGVKCKNDPVRGDVPDQALPIAHPRRFCSWLEALTSACTDPPHPRVENIAIESAANPDQGFVVTYIAGSDVAPHQVALKCNSQFRYYMRSGSSFMPIQHGLLAALFGRRPAPKLQLWLRPITAAHTQYGVYHTPRAGALEEIRLVVGIHNAGRGIALYPALRLYPDRDLPQGVAAETGVLGRTGNGSGNGYGLTKRASLFTGGVNDVIHPGDTLEVALLHYYILDGINRPEIPSRLPNGVDLGSFITQGGAGPINVLLPYDIYCEGFSCRTSTQLNLVGLEKVGEITVVPHPTEY